MKLESPAFAHGEPIPERHSCEEEDVSPALSWQDLPAGTKSLALVMDDPDAPAGTWVHWLVYDIPAAAPGLREGVRREPALADGSKQGLCWGVDDFSRVGYWGPCPPPGKAHRYSFRLYALSAPVGLPPKSTKPQLEKAMRGLVLASAELTGTYRR